MTPEDQPRPLSPLRTLQGMRWWVASAGFGAVYYAITAGAYCTGFALFLGASNALVGLLSAAPTWGQALQFFSPLLIERLPRRKPLCLLSYSVTYLMWLPIALIPLYAHGSAGPWVMIGLVLLSGLAMATASPASTSWLTDLVPEEVRGRYIGRLQTASGTVGLLTSLLAGWYMDRAKAINEQAGFATIFLVAVVFSALAIGAWARVPEPPKMASAARPSAAILTLPFKHPEFRGLLIFSFGRTVAVGIAAPFFTVYLLKSLNVPYSQIAIFSALGTIAGTCTNGFWGYLSDKFGHRPILRISSFMVALNPLFWFFITPHNYLYAVPIAQIWAYACSAGLIMSQLNLMLKTAPEANRSVYAGSFNAVYGLALAIGALLGGALADALEHFGPWTIFGYELASLRMVFMLSCISRLTMLTLMRLVSEPRAVAAREVLRQVRSGNPLLTFWHLLRLSRASNARTKAEAARGLGRAHSALALDELVQALDDSDREVRREAARALGEIGDERAVPPLLAAARDGGADIIEPAVEALGQVPGDAAREGLAELLEDRRPSVRKAAVLGLGRAKDPEAAVPLEGLLAKERDPEVFLAAAEALGHIGGTRSLHVLRRMLAHSRPGVRRRELALSIGSLLGPQADFYKLLQAEPMVQEGIVATIFANARRRLRARVVVRTDERAKLAGQLDEALSAFQRADYTRVASLLRTTASQALHRLIAARSGEPSPGELDRLIHHELEQDAALRTVFGLLSGLQRETRSRALHREEALLAAFAFRQLARRVESRGRRNGRGP